MNKKILWISSLAWKVNEYKYSLDGPGAVSGSAFQQSIIQGLVELGYHVDVISDYPYKERCNRPKRIEINELVSVYYIPTSSNKLVNFFWKYKRIKKAIDYYTTANNYDYAIAYLIHSPFMYGLYYIKRLKSKTVLVCPDLPDMMDMSLNEKPIKKTLKRIDSFLINRFHKRIDGYILFTSQMREKLPIGNKYYEVVEGVASLSDLELLKCDKVRAVMHAGTLHKHIGIEEIISSFEYIEDPNIELWLFGDGELRPYIEKASRKDKRIVYKGFVSREELFRYEQKATLLINARNPKDEYTLYSFPSKTFEYMYSGTPLLTTKLLGIPEEYNKYQILLKSNDPKEIASCIMNHIDDNEKLNEIGLRARQFIMKEKNYLTQAGIIKDLLSRL